MLIVIATHSPLKCVEFHGQSPDTKEEFEKMSAVVVDFSRVLQKVNALCIGIRAEAVRIPVDTSKLESIESMVQQIQLFQGLLRSYRAKVASDPQGERLSKIDPLGHLGAEGSFLETMSRLAKIADDILRATASYLATARKVQN